MISIIPIKFKKTKAILLKGESNILVDTGNPRDFTALSYHLDANLDEDEKLDLIIITHAHVDHYGCVADLKEKTGARVVIHEKDYDCMKRGVNSELFAFSFTGKLIAPFLGKSGDKQVAKPLEADIVMKQDEMDLKQFGVDGTLVHTPGHTPGSISLFLNNKIAIVGDLMMSFFIPEKPERPLFAYDVQVWKRSIKKLLEFEPKEIIVTHGNSYIFHDFESFCKRVL